MDDEKQDDLFKKLEELNKRSEERHRRMQLADEFKPLQGEPAISEDLKKAVSTFVKQKYRGAERWKVVLVYRFEESGTQVKTIVRVDDGFHPIDFTESEAIAIAEKLEREQSR